MGEDQLRSELISALSDVAYWAGLAMDTSKPNSNLYGIAERDKARSERRLVELRSHRP